MESLASTYDLKYLHEPKIDKLDKPLKDIVVKLHLRGRWNKFYSDDFWLRTSKKFDHIIILDRKPTEEWIQSQYWMYKKTNNMFVNWAWDLSKEDKKDWENSRSYFLEETLKVSKELQRISKILNKEVVFYDDLYYDTETDYLNGLKFNPDLNKKLRKEIKKTII